jgi:hypothetical protein
MRQAHSCWILRDIASSFRSSARSVRVVPPARSLILWWRPAVRSQHKTRALWAHDSQCRPAQLRRQTPALGTDPIGETATCTAWSFRASAAVRASLMETRPLPVERDNGGRNENRKNASRGGKCILNNCHGAWRRKRQSQPARYRAQCATC